MSTHTLWSFCSEVRYSKSWHQRIAVKSAIFALAIVSREVCYVFQAYVSYSERILDSG